MDVVGIKLEASRTTSRHSIHCTKASQADFVFFVFYAKSELIEPILPQVAQLSIHFYPSGSEEVEIS